MAQVALTTVGQMLGGPIGAMVGRTLGAYVDASIVASLTPDRQVGRRLTGLQLSSTAEGSPLPASYGRVRVGGQIIWAARFKEKRVEQKRGGGKGGGGGAYSYTYSLSFAVGLGEGPIDGVGRIWADGKVLDGSSLTMRLYTGGADQTPDPLIEAVEGDAPAYRGLAYLVFEDLPLDSFGGRPPSLSVEVFRRPQWPGGPLSLEDRLESVCLIPGAGEAVYATVPVIRNDGYGVSTAENVNSAAGRADILVSLDNLQSQLPNVSHVNLVVAWFGNDLRAGSCRVMPGVESATKETLAPRWSAGGVGRDKAYVVSRLHVAPAYGGTPSDASVLALIAELKARGIGVTLYPFLMLDIGPGNALPDPYGGARQAAFPWRGRITGAVAPGLPGGADRSASARDQIRSFFGSARASDYAVSGGQVSWRGSDGWTYRRMVLHCAALAQAAGGVEGFLIGSEMRGLTTLRSEDGGYPAVAEFRSLAAEVNSLIGATTAIGYTADWSEYFGHQPGDGSGDAVFHLDPLWSDPNIDFVGVDWYPPVTDWRDGTQHRDALAGYSGPSDTAYLAARVCGGEGYDWYYASTADRDAQKRTPITDGAYGEPWVFRPKDLLSWWSNPHHDRRGGVRSAQTTGWVPMMKPMRLIEFGCPAVDKGANSPNLFIDPKSAESGLPPYSSGLRDDIGQRRMLEAVLAHFSDPALNPVSPVYGGPMIAPQTISAWCWDARPFPDFPARTAVWSDAANWTYGHWLNGRAGAATLMNLVASLLKRGGIDPATVDLSGVSDPAQALVQGFAVEGPATLAGILTELGDAFAFDLAERGGRIALTGRDARAVTALPLASLALPPAQGRGASSSGISRSRTLKPAPDTSRIRFSDANRDYQTGQILARSDTPDGGGADAADLPLVLAAPEAQRVGLRRLRRRRAERDTATVAIGPLLAHRLEPGDLVSLPGADKPWRIGRVVMDGNPSLALTGVEAGDAPLSDAPLFEVAPAARPSGPPALLLLDLPPLPGAEDDARPLAAVTSEPWRAIDLSAGPSADALTVRASFTAPSPAGRLLSPLSPGPMHRFDLANTVDVQVFSATLSGQSLNAVLAGANACAIQCANGEWEVLQYRDAVLIAADTWRLGRLLRAQGGSDPAMQAGALAGAAFVSLTADLQRPSISQGERGLPLIWRAAPAGSTATGQGSTDLSAVWSGVALRPWSPCHITGKRLPDRSLLISWVRRARLHGDSLDGEPPLGEEAESWRVDIQSGPQTVRSLFSSVASVTYAPSDQVRDFPAGLPSTLSVVVRQQSAVFGWGAPGQSLLLY